MDNHKEELEIARRTVSVLQLKIDELNALAKEATEREKIANERFEACLRREEELLSLLNAKEQENKSLRAVAESLPTSATPERLRISQDTAENFPPTPAQLDTPRHVSHATFSKADLAINVPSGEADGGMVPASGNLETLDNRVESEAPHSLDSPVGSCQCGRSLFSEAKVVAETSPLPVITELNLSPVVSLIAGLSKIHCEAQTRNEEPEMRGDEIEPEQLEVINQPVPSSYERPSKRRRLIKKHEEVEEDEEDEDPMPALPSLQNSPRTPVYLSSDETSPSTGSSQGTRKRGRRISVRDVDEDYVPSPPSKKELFKSSLAPDATPAHVTLEEHGEAESPGRAAIVGTEFGGGITVTEILKKHSKVTPKRSFKRLRKVSGEVRAEVGRSKRLNQSSEHLEEDEIECSDPFPLLDRRVTPKRPLKRLRRNESVESPPRGATQLRRSQRQSQLPPSLPIELPEDEIESSDGDSFIVESSAESSESTKSSGSTKSSDSTKSSGSSKSSECSKSDSEYEEEDISDLLGSDSESAPVGRRRRGRIAATQGQQSERSESSESSGQASPERAVNLLRASPSDDEEDDDEDVGDGMGDFIDTEGVPAEGSSDDAEPLSDDDDSVSQINIREELVRRRQHLIWDFEGDLLTSIENCDDIALQAICAIYRQQTGDEQEVRDALYRNGRGFDKSNVVRGCTYAEFLIDGDKSGRLKKSPQDFERRFPGEFDSCKAIAKHHSKQLFEIYKNDEDPYWTRQPPQDESLDES